jgi:hypothetical protein
VVEPSWLLSPLLCRLSSSSKRSLTEARHIYVNNERNFNYLIEPFHSSRYFFHDILAAHMNFRVHPRPLKQILLSHGHPHTDVCNEPVQKASKDTLIIGHNSLDAIQQYITTQRALLSRTQADIDRLLRLKREAIDKPNEFMNDNEVLFHPSIFRLLLQY